jgi:carboxypeptidase C (cathepsin A)
LIRQSYGGHYGPEFAHYIQTQNAAINANTTQGEVIDIVALGINNGWYDATLQYKAYIDFSYNNSYKQLITQSQYNSYLQSYNNDCLPAIQACIQSGSNSDCENADSVCYNDIEGPISESGNFDVYDIREPSNDPYPPETYVTYLQSSSVVKAIGAKSTYQECPDAPYNKFAKTGDGKLFLLNSTTYGWVAG